MICKGGNRGTCYVLTVGVSFQWYQESLFFIHLHVDALIKDIFTFPT